MIALVIALSSVIAIGYTGWVSSLAARDWQDDCQRRQCEYNDLRWQRDWEVQAKRADSWEESSRNGWAESARHERERFKVVAEWEELRGRYDEVVRRVYGDHSKPVEINVRVVLHNDMRVQFVRPMGTPSFRSEEDFRESPTVQAIFELHHACYAEAVDADIIRRHADNGRFMSYLRDKIPDASGQKVSQKIEFVFPTPDKVRWPY